MRRLAVVAALIQALTANACGDRGGETSIAGPSPTPAPAPVPDGTITVRGYAADTAFRALQGVAIEVLDGPSAGRTARTDATGYFTLAGIFDDTTRFRATIDGYEPAIRSLQPSCATCSKVNRVIAFDLSLSGGAISISGTYTMTSTASPSCTQIPDEYRSRRYVVTIPARADMPYEGALQGNGIFPLAVSGAAFADVWFYGGIAGHDVAVWTEGATELVAADTFLMMSMSVNGMAESGAGAFRLTGEGGLTYCEVAPGGTVQDCFRSKAVRYATCYGSGQVLEFALRR